MVNTIVSNIESSILSSSAILAEIPNDGSWINVFQLAEILDSAAAPLQAQLRELEAKGLIRSGRTGDNYQRVNEALEAELTRLERKVEKGFYEKGKALTEIRDRALFQSRGFSTFQSYYKERFGYQKSQVYNFIWACEIYDNLSPFCETLPNHESQCRPLVGEETEIQVKAWQAAYADADGKVPSAKQVKEALRDIKRENNNPWKVGDVVKIVHCPEEKFRKGRIAIVTQVLRVSIKVKDFLDENISLHFDDVKKTDWETLEDVEKLFEDLKEISLISNDPIVQVNVNYLAKLDKLNLTDKEKFVLEMLKMGDAEIINN